jgi:Family of unknown function (DUF6159)
MNRIGRGWMLTKESWRLVRADRTLLWFPVVGALAGLVVAAVFVGGAIALQSATGSEVLLIVPLVIGAYLLAVVATFCNVALAVCVSRALDGHDTTVAEGLAAARGHLDSVFGWAGVQLVVGGISLLLQALLREAGGQLVSSIFGGLANAAWEIASFFVIPGIALDDLGPREALRRSVQVIRQRWGEGVTGSAAIGVIFLLCVWLPVIAVIVVGVLVSSSVAGLGIALIAIGVVALVIGVVVQTTLSATFRVALYRFATQDTVLGPFERGAMEAAFRPKRRGRGLAS